MKKRPLFVTIIVTSFMLFSTGCGTAPAGDGSVIVTESEGNSLTVCNFNNVKDTVTLNLSDLVQDFKIVRFENKDEAYFKPALPIITDKYIGIRQSNRPFLLFDHTGKLICKVGSIGGGPGEYTSLYDEAIQDQPGKVYLSPFANSRKVLEYNTDGSFVGEIIVKANLNKPKIDVSDNGDITLVHMPFSTDEDPFLALQYDKDGHLKSELKPSGGLLVQAMDPTYGFVGFNNEVFSYRNTPDFSFMITSCDTLFHYDKEKNKAYPKFTMNFGRGEEIPGHIYSEIANYYLTVVFGKGVIYVDKKKNTSDYIKIVNDFFGHMDAPTFNFNKGWFYQMFEPSSLVEKIEERLAKSDCSAKDRKQLEEMMSSLDENDNNVLFIAKLK
ncbi:6-bladed beta-propeller [Parabacteroides sp. Marseille-P3160]|uniref:6-bladed beta-propeller n=1 Tax=Parabacteroides sp. Marseille-P3160 TaxID=1917887 RepID=UPI0009B9A2AA|nr:6-bladed beta-propeller [Parabacteroides sp. Marseille-P3160]